VLKRSGYSKKGDVVLCTLCVTLKELYKRVIMNHIRPFLGFFVSLHK
jgi:hypothetical protein